MRTTLLLLLLLAGAISGMLYWQWHSYTTLSSERIMDEGSQHFSVEHVGQELNITQTVSGLNNEKFYNVQLPQLVEHITCVYDNENECKVSENKLQTFQPKDGSFVLSYSLPLKKVNDALLLEQWFVTLNDVKMKYTEVEITEGVLRNGTWAAGAPLAGKVSLDLIDYFSFKKQGEAFPIYWQSQSLEYVEKGDYLSFYTADPASLVKLNSSVRAFENLSIPRTTIIVTDLFENYRSSKLIITNQIDVKEIYRSIVLENLSKQHAFSSFDERWMLEIFLPSIANIEIQNEKAKQLYKELTEKITEADFKSFVNIVFSQNNEKITAEKLDAILGNQKGMKTKFFSLNREEGLPFVPLYFYDNRKVVVNSEEKDLNIIAEEMSLLFPFIETMQALGFKVSALSDNETLLVNKGFNAYRFYLNKNIFIYNEEDYGLLTSPLTTINKEVYIDKYWLEAIFKVTITETKDQLVVVVPQQ